MENMNARRVRGNYGGGRKMDAIIMRAYGETSWSVLYPFKNPFGENPIDGEPIERNLPEGIEVLHEYVSGTGLTGNITLSIPHDFRHEVRVVPIIWRMNSWFHENEKGMFESIGREEPYYNLGDMAVYMDEFFLRVLRRNWNKGIHDAEDVISGVDVWDVTKGKEGFKHPVRRGNLVNYNEEKRIVMRVPHWYHHNPHAITGLLHSGWNDSDEKEYQNNMGVRAKFVGHLGSITILADSRKTARIIRTFQFNDRIVFWSDLYNKGHARIYDVHTGDSWDALDKVEPTGLEKEE